MTGGRRLVALSTASVTYAAGSSDSAERARSEEVRRAEEDVGRLCRERGIAWTILRPTLIYDPGRDRNVSAIAAVARRFGFVPVAWPATGRRQPIHADDVAQAMVAALDAPGAADAILGLPGGETLTYRDMVRRIFQSLGRRPVLLYLPLGPARLAFRVWLTADGCRLQCREPRADEYGPDARSGSSAGGARNDVPAVPPRVFRMTDRPRRERRRLRGQRAP